MNSEIQAESIPESHRDLLEQPIVTALATTLGTIDTPSPSASRMPISLVRCSTEYDVTP